MSGSIPRFLLPRGYILPLQLSTSTLRPSRAIRQKLPTCKHASTTTPIPKVFRLEKPAKFNPPSHGKRLKQQIPRHYGPQLTQEQKVEQNTKQYPKMMPPPGSFMFWFLTNRGIHVFISLVRFSCAPANFLYFFPLRPTKGSVLCISSVCTLTQTLSGHPCPPRLIHRL